MREARGLPGIKRQTPPATYVRRPSADDPRGHRRRSQTSRLGDDKRMIIRGSQKNVRRVKNGEYKIGNTSNTKEDCGYSFIVHERLYITAQTRPCQKVNSRSQIRPLSGYDFTPMPIHLGYVHKLVRYPVKSMAGVETNSAVLGWHGLAGDRPYAVRRLNDNSGFPRRTP